MLTTTKARGSTLKFMVMIDLTKDAQGNYKRPATFATAALSLPEVTTSDVPVTHASKATTENSVMYGSAATGAGTTWADTEPGEGSWQMSVSGNWQPGEEDRANYEAARAAQMNGSIVWIERTVIGETVPEGGAAWINQGSLPAPADATVTFSFNLTGKGKFFTDASAATSAG